MNLDLSHHSYFEKYIDKQTGAESYILKEKVAQIQQNFYFSEIGLTEDNEYMWFQCMNWPAEFIYLGVISMNPEKPYIKAFPAAGFQGGGNKPNLIPGTHDAIFAAGSAVYRIDVFGNIKKVFEIDEEFLTYRTPDRLSTQLTVNSAGKLVALDMRIAGKTYLATGNLETGEVKMLHKFNRHYDHAQFSAIDPKLILLDQDWERDYHTGERFDIDQRMWLIDTDCTKFEPVLPKKWFRHGSIICHDFWSKDGWICWPDYDAVYEYNIESEETNKVWDNSMCHVHTNDRKYWVGDASPYTWDQKPCRVIFFNRESGKEIDIFSALPKPNYKSGGVYHLDPHPQFSRDGESIISMTTVNDGEVDISITPVKPLAEICS